MARTNNLTNFLTDVADAIRSKTGSSASIQASEFDTEIENIPTGADLDDYFQSYNAPSSVVSIAWQNMVKEIPEGYKINFSGTRFINAMTGYPGKSIDLSGFDTSNTTEIYNFLNGATNLESVDLSTLDLRKATPLTSMVGNCSSLKTFDMHGLSCDVSRSFESMCTECSVLETANLTGLQGPNITNMARFFYRCIKLNTISGISSLNFPKCNNYNYMFDSCSSLTGRLDLSGLTVDDNLTYVECQYMFNGCKKLTEIDLRNFNIGKFNTNVRGRGMFSVCTNLTSVLLGGDAVGTFGTNMFSTSGITATTGYIYVPDDLVDSYKAASGWSTYANRIHGISEYPISE